MNAKQLAGKRFGKLVAIRATSQRANKQILWECKCDCGNVVLIRSGHLGKSRISCNRSCHQTTHGQSNTKLCAIWLSIIGRTTNPTNPAYSDYGERGITLYRKWIEDFVAFRDYVTALPNCPAEVLSIGGPRIKQSLDRINNNKGYKPGNLRWADRVTQNTNQRRTRLIRVRNVGTLTLKETALHFKIPYGVLTYRLRSGMTPKEAVTTPVRTLR